MRRATAVAIGLAMVLTIGCGTSSGADSAGSPTASPSPSGSTLPIGFVDTFGGSYSGIDHGTSLEPEKAELIGPHSFLQLDGVARTRTLTEDQLGGAGLGKLTAPLHARSGHEIVLAHVAPTGDTQPGLSNYTGDAQGDSKATVVVDGKNRKLPEGVSGDETIVVQVPADAPVKLRMNDGNRPQELDLRTGKRTRTASPLYYPVRVASPSFADAYYTLGNGEFAELMADSGEVVLAPYADKLGWARKGRAWLLVSVGIDTSSDTQFKAKVTQSLTLSAAGANSTGRAVTSGDTATNPDVNTLATGGINLAFDVPATLRSGTLNYLPVGTFVVDGKTVSASPYQGGDPTYNTTTQHKHFTLKPRS